MENIVSSTDLTISCQEADYKGNYRVSCLLSRLADLATENALEVGIWKREFGDKYGFVLTKETLVLKRPIKVEEKIILNTRAAACKRIQFNRNYWVEDEDGNEIGAVYSLWTLIDLEKRKITRPDKAGITMPEIKPYKYTLEEYHEIIKDLELSLVMERMVLYSDVDVNLHMNNSRYIEWAFDVLPLDLFEHKYFKEISVVYKKEMSPQTKAKIYSYLDDDYVKVVFKSLDDKVIYFEMGGYLSEY